MARGEAYVANYESRKSRRYCQIWEEKRILKEPPKKQILQSR